MNLLEEVLKIINTESQKTVDPKKLFISSMDVLFDNHQIPNEERREILNHFNV